MKAGLYLEIGALLHDIGYYMSSKEHHRYSAELISASEILGLTSYEINLISLIAKYHRKLMPDNTRSDFTMLPSNHRVMIITLASIVKISEALDKSHTQLIEDISAEIDDEELIYFL